LESNKTLVEFCLPFTELKHIVEGMVEDDSTTIEMEYPVGDNYLQIRIPDEPRGGGQIFRSETCLKLETYEAQHTLDADFSANKYEQAAQFFGRVHHFKKALREF